MAMYPLNSTIGSFQPLAETIRAHHFVSLALLGLLLSVLYFSYQIIYLLYFHPLSKFPGPKLNAISPIPFSLSALQGVTQHELVRLHEKYGPVVRVEPNSISFILADAWKDVYSWSNTKRFQKARVVQPKNGVHTLPMIVDDATHMRHRKFYNSAFSDRALRGQEKKIMEHIDLFIQRLGEAGSVDIRLWIEFLMFDVIGDLAFGEPFGCLKESSSHRWVAMLSESMKSMAMVGVMSGSTLFDKLLYLMKRGEVRQLLNTLADHNQMSGEKVRERLAQGENKERQDFWSYFLQKNNSEKDALTPQEMEMVGSTLIVGGSETTGAALCATVYYLLRTTDAWNRLCHEIRGAFSKETDIDMLSVAPLPYLNATIQEGMRLYPPAPIGLMRVTPEGGSMVAGNYIPEGTLVSIPQFPADRCKLNFADPTTFAPSRWLTPPPEKYAGDNRDVFNPFSMGPRNCVGKSLALAEMKLIIAKLIWNFDMEFCEGTAEAWEPERQRVFIFWEKPEMMVKLKKRV